MISPAYQRGGVTLYHGDALAVLAELPDASIGALVTDPPYSSGGMFRGDRMRGTSEKYTGGPNQKAAFTDFSGDNRDQRAYGYWCALWLSECLRVAEAGAFAAIFTDWRQLPMTTDAIQSGGWVWHGIIPWFKPNARSFAGRFTASCEYAVWGSKGALPNPLDGGRSFRGFYEANSPQDRDHPAQKPVEIVRALLAPSRGIVLDPFTGSGTTAIACIREGRSFVGVEQKQEYFDVAVGRIDAEFAQGKLFGASA